MKLVKELVKSWQRINPPVTFQRRNESHFELLGESLWPCPFIAPTATESILFVIESKTALSEKHAVTATRTLASNFATANCTTSNVSATSLRLSPLLNQ
jgi:hypothetical protein